MPRPKAVNPNVKLHVSLPPDVYAKLRLIFHSDVHAYGIAKGAISDFITQAVKEKLDRLREASNA